MSDYLNGRKYAVSLEFPAYTGPLPQPANVLNPKIWFGSHDSIRYPNGVIPIDARLLANDGISDFSWDAQFYSGKYSISNLTLKIVDKNGALSNEIASKLVNNIGTRHAVIRVFEVHGSQQVVDVGPLQNRFDSMNSNVIATYFMMDHSFDRGKITINCKDIIRQMKNVLFEDKDLVLTQPLLDSDTSIRVITPDFDDFDEAQVCFFEHNERYSLHPGNNAQPAVCAYLRFRDSGEIIAVEPLPAGSGFSNVIPIKDRALFNTVSQQIQIDSGLDDQRNGPQVENIVYIEEFAPELLYMLLTGLSNSGPTPRVLPPNYNLGINPKWVNEYSFFGDNSNNGTADNLRLRVLKSEPITNAKTWIEDHILMPMRSVLHVNRFGQIELVKAQATSEGSEQVVLDHTNIVPGTISPLKHIKTEIYNPIVLEYDKSILDGKYKRVHGYDDSSSTQANHDTEVKRFQFDTLYSGINTASQIDKIRVSLQDFYAHEHQELTLNVLPSMWHTHLQIGHRPRVRIPKMRNDAQTEGNIAEDIDKVFMVRGITRSVMNCGLQLRLISNQQRATDNPRTDSEWEIPKEKYPVDKVNLLDVPAFASQGSNSPNPNGDDNFIFSGSATLDGGRYYIIGDLTINGTINSRCVPGGTGDLEIWVCGRLTVNGKVDTSEQGCHKPGVAQQSIGPVTDINYGEPGLRNSNMLGEGAYFGTPNTVGGSAHNRAWGRVIAIPPVDEVTGEVEEVPELHLSNECGCLRGIPPTVSGTPSSGSSASYEWTTGLSGALSKTDYPGLDGVHGGGGIVFVSRGGAFGISGKVCTNGEDAAAPYLMPGGIQVVNSGGMPGAFLWLTDGDIHTPPFDNITIKNHFDAYAGDSFTTQTPYRDSVAQVSRYANTVDGSHYYKATDHTINRAVAASRHQYVPQNQKLDESQDTHWLDDEAALNPDNQVVIWGKKQGDQYKNLVNGLPPVPNPNPRDLYIDCANQDSGLPQVDIEMWRYDNGQWNKIVGPDSTAAFFLDICRRFGTATIHFGPSRPINYEPCDVWFNEETDKSVKLGANASDDTLIWARQYGDLGEDVLEDGNFLVHHLCEPTWQTDTNRSGGPQVYPGNFPKYVEQVVGSTTFSPTIGENATPGWQLDATGTGSYRILRPRRPIKIHPGEKYIVESIIFTTGLNVTSPGTQGYSVFPSIFDQNGNLLFQQTPLGTSVHHHEDTTQLTTSGWFRVHHEINISETLTDARYLVPNCCVHALSGNVIVSQVHCRRDFEVHDVLKYSDVSGAFQLFQNNVIGFNIVNRALTIPAASRVNMSFVGDLSSSIINRIQVSFLLTFNRNGVVRKSYIFGPDVVAPTDSHSLDFSWDHIAEEYYDSYTFRLNLTPIGFGTQGSQTSLGPYQLENMESSLNVGRVVQSGNIEALI